MLVLPRGFISMNNAEKTRLQEIFKSSKGIVDHEFSQDVIDAVKLMRTLDGNVS